MKVAIHMNEIDHLGVNVKGVVNRMDRYLYECHVYIGSESFHLISALCS